jgi:AAA family ATP:ADP antiporter
VVKALNKLRLSSQLRFPDDAIDKILVDECKSYYETWQVLRLQNHTGGNVRGQLLKKALEERLELNLERIFRLLGLRYPPKDIFSTYLGLKSGRHTQRASAIEFLDNLLPANLKKYIFPIIDEPSAELIARRGAQLFGIRLTQRQDAVLFLFEGRDLWLKCCAIHALETNESAEIRSALGQLAVHSDQLVRETAILAAARINGLERISN